MPGNSALVQIDAPSFTIIAVTDDFPLNSGNTREELVGKGIFELFPSNPKEPGDMGEQTVRDSFEYVIRYGKAHQLPHLRYDVRGKDGTYEERYWVSKNKPVKDSNGKVVYIIHSAEEITSQIKAERREELMKGLETEHKTLKEAEQRARSIVESAPFPIGVYVGREMKLELLNQAIMDTWGKGNDVAGKLYKDVLPELDPIIYQQLDDVFTTGIPVHVRNQRIDLLKEGKMEVNYFNYSFTPLYDAAGNIYGVMNTAADVTDLNLDKQAVVLARQKIEEVVSARTKELAEANNNLQRSNAELAQFAYIASHDLQEPLRKVSTFAQMLEHSLGNVDERSKSYLNKINASTSRMSTLIRDVLTYSQLSKEKDVLEQVNLQLLIENIESDFELLIEQKQATIHCKDLPVIEAISLQMSQLFSNLISNALKFSKTGIPPEINFTSTKLSAKDAAAYGENNGVTEYYHIICSDNGIGFQQEHAAQIFNIFQRLHGKTEYSGTGIGLAMCKKIVQNHHGEIFALSEPGKGTVFNIILPATQTNFSLTYD